MDGRGRIFVGRRRIDRTGQRPSLVELPRTLVLVAGDGPAACLSNTHDYVARLKWPDVGELNGNSNVCFSLRLL